MKTELGLQNNEARIVTGLKGIHSKAFRRRFASQAAQDRWEEANAGDIEIHCVERA